MRIGYIGLGALGGALARQFLPEHELVVWDLNPHAVLSLQKDGATVADDAADLARQVDVVFVCLPRSADVHRLIFSPRGLAEGLSPGALVVDQTSGMPGETRAMADALAARGCAMIDASVSGSPHIALQRGATLMASGSDDAFERALPILRGMAKSVLRCGRRVGDGQAMKAVNNAMNAANRLGTLEVVAMGRKAGLSLRDMTDAFVGSAGANLTTERMLPAMIEGRESTDFALTLALKDINQALQLGMEVGVPMPVSSEVRALFQVGLNTLGAGAKLEDMIGLVERLAGTTFVGEPSATTERHEGLSNVVHAVAVICTAVTLECATLAREFGLRVEDMDVIVNASSGWSAASRRLLPSLASGVNGSSAELSTYLPELRHAMRLGMDVGAPLQLLGAVLATAELESRASVVHHTDRQHPRSS